MAAHAKRIFDQLSSIEVESYSGGRPTDLGAQRLRNMNEAAVAMQIPSFAGPVNSMHMGEPQASLVSARSINEELKKAAEANPQRFRTFAELPTNVPDLAIQELLSRRDQVRPRSGRDERIRGRQEKYPRRFRVR